MTYWSSRSEGDHGAVVAGVPPDAFTAIQNALQFYAIDEIVISTFPGERSGWLRAGLIDRVQRATNIPVEHVAARSADAENAAA